MIFLVLSLDDLVHYRCPLLQVILCNFLSCEIQLMSQAYYYKPDGPLLPAPWGILVMHAMWNMVCSSWVFSNGEAHRSHFFSPWSLIVKRRNIRPGTSSNGWRDHRRKQKMEQGKKFFNFWGHCFACDCRTEQPKARKLRAALRAGLGNSSNSRKTTTKAMTTKTSSKLNGNVCPLMDPQPSTSSYLPPVE